MRTRCELPRALFLAIALIAACVAPGHEAREIQRSVRVGRVLIEQHGEAGRWEGTGIVHEEAEVVLARAEEELRALVADRACVHIELALPREVCGELLGRFDAQLGPSQFRRLAALKPLPRDPGEHFMVATYLRAPEAILELSTEDPRADAIGGTIWEAHLPFSWEWDEERWRLWVPGVWRDVARGVLAETHRLTDGDREELGLGVRRGVPTRGLPSVQDDGLRAHRFALLEGPRDRIDMDRFLSQVRRPTRPWAVEMLMDQKFSYWRGESFGSDELCLELGLDWNEDEDGWLFDFFFYGSIGVYQPVGGSPSGRLRVDLLAVGGAQICGGEVGGDHGFCHPANRRLWKAGIPYGLELSMDIYVFVPGVYYPEALRVLAREPSHSPEFDPILRQPRAGDDPPSIDSASDEERPFTWSDFSGQRVLLLFNDDDIAGAKRVMRLVAAALAEAEQSGRPHRFVLIANADDSRDALLGHGDFADSTASFMTAFDEDLGEAQGFLRIPSGLVVDEAGRVAHVIEFDYNYYSFVEQLRRALGLEPTPER